MIHYWEPYLVVGPGRCGTSFVASVLHEELGVSMGSRFRDPDETNPRGYYEDMWFRDANQSWLDGTLPAHEWRNAFGRLLVERRSAARAWGLKDPRLAHVIDLAAPFVRWSRVVRCRRPLSDVVDSMRRCYGWTLDCAAGLAAERERLLDQLPVLVDVDIGAGPTRGDVAELLREVVRGP